MSKYSYAECLRNAYKVNWRIEEVLGERRFDPARPWLPNALSGAHAITCLDARERIAASPLEEVVVTNTVPPDGAPEKITVLSVARLLGEGIRRIHENASVSSLFL